MENDIEKKKYHYLTSGIRKEKTDLKDNILNGISKVECNISKRIEQLWNEIHKLLDQKEIEYNVVVVFNKLYEEDIISYEEMETWINKLRKKKK